MRSCCAGVGPEGRFRRNCICGVLLCKGFDTECISVVDRGRNCIFDFKNGENYIFDPPKAYPLCRVLKGKIIEGKNTKWGEMRKQESVQFCAASPTLWGAEQIVCEIGSYDLIYNFGEIRPFCEPEFKIGKLYAKSAKLYARLGVSRDSCWDGGNPVRHPGNLVHT